MLDAVAGAFQALRTATDMIQLAVDARDAAKLADAKSAMLARIIDAQSAYFNLASQITTCMQAKHALERRVNELEKQLEDLADQKQKMAEYELVQTPGGAVVFVHKPSKDAVEGPIYACATCMERGEITYLNSNPARTLLQCVIHGQVVLRDA